MFKWAAAGRETLDRHGLNRLLTLAFPEEKFEGYDDRDWREMSANPDIPQCRFDPRRGMALAQFVGFIRELEPDCLDKITAAVRQSKLTLVKLTPVFEWAAAGRETLDWQGLSRLLTLPFP